MAGPNGGYGLYVKLQHTSDVGTAYAHMSRLGPGIKPGVAVRQGQVIGFVGSTGMSTGPHLHYEFHRGGRQVNPLAQKFAMRAQVGGKDAARFQASGEAISRAAQERAGCGGHQAEAEGPAAGCEGRLALAGARHSVALFGAATIMSGTECRAPSKKRARLSSRPFCLIGCR